MGARQFLTSQRPWRLTVDEYMRLADAGAFGDRKTELLDGQIYVMSPQYAQHMKAKVGLLLSLVDACRAIDGGYEAWSEGSVLLAQRSMPMPDLLVTRVSPTTGPLDVSKIALVCEVADATVRSDLTRKAKLYAKAGVPEYWVVDLPGRQVHQLWSPGQAGYAERRALAFGERVEAVTIPGLSVGTDAL